MASTTILNPQMGNTRSLPEETSSTYSIVKQWQQLWQQRRWFQTIKDEQHIHFLSGLDYFKADQARVQIRGTGSSTLPHPTHTCSGNRSLLFLSSYLCVWSYSLLAWDSDGDAIIRKGTGHVFFSESGVEIRFVRGASLWEVVSTVCHTAFSAYQDQWVNERWQFIYSLWVESTWTVLNDSKQSWKRAMCSTEEKKRHQDYQGSARGNGTAE